jgi:hypothetical protein
LDKNLIDFLSTVFGGQSGPENSEYMEEEWIDNSRSSIASSFIKNETDYDDIISEDGI